MTRLRAAITFAVVSLVLGHALAAQAPPAQAPPTPRAATGWMLTGTAANAYAMEAAGQATDPQGATVWLRATRDVAATQFGTVMATVPADRTAGGQVTLSGELQTRGATAGASLWLRVDRGTSMLLLDNGMGREVRGDTDWMRWSVSLPVPQEATQIAFGVLLNGPGSVGVRGLRLQAGRAIAPTPSAGGAAAPNGSIAPSAKKVLDEAIEIVKANALRGASVDWKAIEPETRAMAAGARQSSDVYPAIRVMLTKLGDNHSFLMPPQQTSAFRTGGAQNAPAEVRALPDKVGYIVVPAYFGGEPAAARAYAAKMQEGIAAAKEGARCGWIVDLRNNGGGNMWPMLAGLRPLAGDGPLGSFEGPKGRTGEWRAKGQVDVPPPASLASLEDAWVAVLTGPRTASSGEAVAIAFRGRARTRSFGQPTRGLSTANGSFGLSDGSMLMLTTAVDVDRTGTRYGGKIEPDEILEAEPAAAPADDAVVAAATRWLVRSSGCSVVSVPSR